MAFNNAPSEINNICDYLAPSLDCFENRNVQIDGDREVYVPNSWIKHKAETIFHLIKDINLGIEEKIVLLKIANPLNLTPLLLAFWKAGFACALVDPNCKPVELQHMQAITLTTFLIEDEPNLRVSVNGVALQGLNSNLLNAFTFAPLDYVQVPLDSPSPPNSALNVQLDDLALVLTSSGSTGLPKGVALSHRNLIAVLQDSKSFTEENTKALCVLPLSHAFGLILMLMCLKEGSRLVLMRKFNTKSFFAAAHFYKVETLFIVPPILKVIYENLDYASGMLNCVTKILTGASHVKVQWQEKVSQALPRKPKIYHSYGLTETTFTVFHGESRAEKPGSPGKVCSGFTCKVADPCTGEDLPSTHVGELLVKSNSVMLGYLNNPPATCESFTADDWLRTGDLGCFDEDGYFYVKDRIKEVIKYNSHQISPSELEKVISQIEGVVEAAVVGVPHPCYGETPQAIVIKDNESDLTESQIMSVVAENLSAHKQLHSVVFVGHLPKTPSGKIQRRKALEMIFPARDSKASIDQTPASAKSCANSSFEYSPTN